MHNYGIYDHLNSILVNKAPIFESKTPILPYSVLESKTPILQSKAPTVSYLKTRLLNLKARLLNLKARPQAKLTDITDC